MVRKGRLDALTRLAVLALTGALACGSCGRRQPVMATAAVIGTVSRAAAGGPIAGASVVLTVDPDLGRVPAATIRTNAAGAFRVERLPVGRYLVKVHALGFVEAIAPVVVTAPTTRPLEVKLAPTVSLEGKIEDGRGAGVPLARVLVFAIGDTTSSKIHETRADERGTFKVLGLAAGAHRLLIEAPGLGTVSAGPVQAPDQNLVVVLPGEIRAIVGRVTRTTMAVPGARVLLGGEAVAETRSLETDGEGRFAFAGLGPGVYVLRAEAGGLVTPVTKEVVLERAPANARPLELTLAPGSYAHGQVTGEGGRAVAGAAVQIDLVPATGLWPPVFTDANGRWTSAPLGPGTYRIRARHDGFVARRTATVSIPPVDFGQPPALPATTLELLRTGEITGRVVDEHGAPVTGAQISDRLAEAEELGVIWARLPLAAEAAAQAVGSVVASTSSRASSRRATSDATGRFVLREVPPGRVQVEVLNASSVPLRTRPVTLAAGGRLDVGILRAPSAIQFTGRVVDFEGRPVSGARINVSAAAAASGSATEGAGSLYAVTGGDGTFSLPLPAGEHRLTAIAPGHRDATVTVRLPAVGLDNETTLRLGKGGASTTAVLEGTVQDKEGRPLARARLAVRAAAALESTALITGLTDPGGAFRLVGVPAERVLVEVQHDGYAPHRQEIDLGSPPNKTLRIVVPLPGGIDGEVHEHITGAPVPKFQIDAQGPDGAHARFPETAASRKRDGGGPLRFSLRRLTPGRWTLRVQASGYRPLERVVEVASATTPGDASVRDLRLELERS